MYYINKYTKMLTRNTARGKRREVFLDIESDTSSKKDKEAEFMFEEITGRRMPLDSKTEKIIKQKSKINAVSMVSKAKESARAQIESKKLKEEMGDNYSLIISSASSRSLANLSADQVSQNLNYALEDNLRSGADPLDAEDFFKQNPRYFQKDNEDPQVNLLKDIYRVNSRDAVVEKIREQIGLDPKKIHPVHMYREASTIKNLTQSPYLALKIRRNNYFKTEQDINSFL